MVSVVSSNWKIETKVDDYEVASAPMPSLMLAQIRYNMACIAEEQKLKIIEFTEERNRVNYSTLFALKCEGINKW